MLNKRQEAELVTSIQGSGEVPLKFHIWVKELKTGTTIAQERSKGGINSTETHLLKRRAQDFLESFEGKEKINIIDIGCGDGTPILPILEELKRQNITFRYVPLDISPEMLDFAERTITKKYPDCKIKKIVLDFELGNFSDITYDLKSDGSANLLCFLGSTLGNFSDRNRVLTNIRDSMSADDFLIVGVEMTNFSKIAKVIPHYTAKEVEDFYLPFP